MSSSEESSFLLASNPDLSQADIDEEIDSLPSSDDDDSTVSDSEEFHSDAEKQWRESLQQLELLLTMVVVPYMGKYFGRKAAYYGWGRWMEWMYPVQVVISDKGAFRAAGLIGAASAL